MFETNSPIIRLPMSTSHCVRQRRAWGVFPANPDQHSREFKKPLTAHGYHSSSRQDFIVKLQWSKNPGALVGIDLETARLLVVDVDRKPNKPNGFIGWDALIKKREADLAGAPLVITPNNGHHYYFKLPPTMEPTNSEGDLPEEINIRSAGYAIAPGTMVATGQGWFPAADSLDPIEAYELDMIPELPTWLRQIIETKQKHRGNHRHHRHLHRNANGHMVAPRSIVSPMTWCASRAGVTMRLTDRHIASADSPAPASSGRAKPMTPSTVQAFKMATSTKMASPPFKRRFAAALTRDFKILQIHWRTSQRRSRTSLGRLGLGRKYIQHNFGENIVDGKSQ
jgi:hypothetical protein